MNFLPPWSGRHSGRATPSLRADQTTAKPTGRESTYPAPIPVQTNPATAVFINAKQAISMLQITYNHRLHVSKIALLNRIGTRQIVNLLLRRHDDSFLGQQDLRQSCICPKE